MNPAGRISALFLVSVLLLSVLSSFLVPYDPEVIDLDHLKEPPSLKHVLGTDNKGRDVLARLLAGGRLSLGTVIFSALIAASFGLILGLISGYVGGKADMLLMGIVDLFLAFPSFLLAIGVSILFTAGVNTVIIALAVTGWPGLARVIRGHVLTLRDTQFVEAARAIGCGHMRVLFHHIMPQCIPLTFVMTGIKLGGLMLAEAGLSFLGLGAQPPASSWGSMVSANRAFIHSAPWMVIPPGLIIAAVAISFNLLGDDLREKYDRSINREV